MTIYWLLLLLSFVLWKTSTGKDHRLRTEYAYMERIRSKKAWPVVVLFAVLTFFCGLRSGIADTGAYIHMFKNFPVGLDNIVWEEVERDKGFYLLSVLYKTYISTDYQGWLFLIAMIGCVATGIGIKRYASDAGFSGFLFIATTMFTYLLNGIRQYVCISILFAITSYIQQRKFFKYAIWVLLLSTIHNSAIIMIPAYFLARTRPWSISTVLIIAGGAIMGYWFDAFFPMVESMLEETSYSDYANLLEDGQGGNIFRLLIAAVPVVLSYICRQQIYETKDRFIPIAVNMSIINLALYFIATFTSGMTVGRMTAYFDIYNIVLLPWLINSLPSMRDRKTIRDCAVVAYVAFFYYQMVMTWNLPYESEVLNLFIY